MKTANGKTQAFQTPAPRALTQKPNFGATSPRLRKAKFQVHEARTESLRVEPEEREIEYMHPREVPLPDYPDDDLWPHDRLYPQFEGANFTRGWALEFLNADEEESFDVRMKQFEAKASRQAISAKQNPTRTTMDSAPATFTSTRAASALSGVRGIASFASATTSSIARAKVPASNIKATTKATTSGPRHTVAKVASNTTIGFSKGRRVSITNRASQTTLHESTPWDEFEPLTAAERGDVLNAMWRHGDTSDDNTDDFYAPMLNSIDIHDLRDFGSEIPDD